MKFARLVAAGQHSVTECYVLAGYGTKRDSSNANKLKRSLADIIAAERAKLGLPPEGVEDAAPEIEDADKAHLLELQRKLYADAVEAGNLPIQRAALREITKLMKRQGKPGRPASNVVASSKPATAHVPVDWNLVFDTFFTPEENAEYEREIAAGPEIERQRELWLSGKPSNYIELAYPGAKSRTLADGSTLLDFDETSDDVLALEKPEPSLASELRSSTSYVALEAGEKVRRL